MPTKVFPLLSELFGVLGALAWSYTHTTCTTHRCAGRTSERTPALPSLFLPFLYDPLQATAPGVLSRALESHLPAILHSNGLYGAIALVHLVKACWEQLSIVVAIIAWNHTVDGSF
ncbi:hypothetical protein B0T20DRAFT_216641 [Sordaria brevicollis]|uniref:Secreted protein n=1 Tax=Sordaria brevicollis TaxID=83679 RepID=A0AAE0UC73_SORBR|nr:hypothetical protein B0T20DRAFT_216641 [Sordaria brevicollis]